MTKITQNMYLKPINGGNKMKTYISALLIAFTAFQLNAQDDIYYSGSKDDDAQNGSYFTDDSKNSKDSVSIDNYTTRDAEYSQQQGNVQPDSTSTEVYRSEDGDTYITNYNYYNGDNYEFEDNDDYYDYEYASRIRRFNRPYYGFGYYDDCYTNYY